LRLSGKLIKDTNIIKEKIVEINDDTLSYTDLLEACLIALCKELDIQVPIWLRKNTSEFVMHRKTSFLKDQFMEDIIFDRFEMKVE